MDVWLRHGDHADEALSHERLVRRFGRPAAERVIQRLQELIACETLLDAQGLPGGCRELGGASGTVAVTVRESVELRLRPQVDPAPRQDDGSLDLAAIRDVIVIDVSSAEAD